MKYDYGLRPLKFWCQKVLPLVYDESLSYEELLCKVVAYLNNVILDVNKIPEYIQEYLTEDVLADLLSGLLNELREQIARANEEKSDTATANRNKGDLVWLDDKLAQVTRDMLAGDRYVEDTGEVSVTGNFVYTSIEKVINDVKDDIEAIIGNLNNLQTEEKDSVVNAINSLISEFNTSLGVIAGKIGDLDDLNTQSKDNLVNAINECLLDISALNCYVSISEYGAVAGTDCTTAINNAIANEDFILIPQGTYYVDGSTPRRTFLRNNVETNFCAGIDIYRKNNKHIICLGTIQDITTDGAWAHIVNIEESSNISWNGGTLKGNIDTHIADGSEWYHGFGVYSSDNVNISDVEIYDMYGDGIYTGVFYHNNTNKQQGKVSYRQCNIAHCGRNGISVCSSTNTLIDGCRITDVKRTAPKSGIDVEGEGVGYTKAMLQGVKINNSFVNDCEIGIWVAGGTTESVDIDVEAMIKACHYSFRTTSLTSFTGGGTINAKLMSYRNSYGGSIVCNENDKVCVNIDEMIEDGNTENGTTADSSALILLGTNIKNVNAKVKIGATTYAPYRGVFFDGTSLKNVHIELYGTFPMNTFKGTKTNCSLTTKDTVNGTISDIVANSYNALRANMQDQILYIDGLLIPSSDVATDGVLFKINILPDRTVRLGTAYDLSLTASGYVIAGTSIPAGTRISINSSVYILNYVNA